MPGDTNFNKGFNKSPKILKEELGGLSRPTLINGIVSEILANTDIASAIKAPYVNNKEDAVLLKVENLDIRKYSGAPVRIEPFEVKSSPQTIESALKYQIEKVFGEEKFSEKDADGKYQEYSVNSLSVQFSVLDKKGETKQGTVGFVELI